MTEPIELKFVQNYKPQAVPQPRWNHAQGLIIQLLAGYSLSTKADSKRIMKKNEWKLAKICQVQESTTKMLSKKKKEKYLKNNYFGEFWTNKNSFN